jgi:hypothetical protein
MRGAKLQTAQSVSPCAVTIHEGENFPLRFIVIARDFQEYAIIRRIIGSIPVKDPKVRYIIDRTCH